MNLRGAKFAVARKWVRVPAAIGAVLSTIATIAWKAFFHPLPVPTWLVAIWAVILILGALVGLPAAWFERENMLARQRIRLNKRQKNKTEE